MVLLEERHLSAILASDPLGVLMKEATCQVNNVVYEILMICPSVCHFSFFFLHQILMLKSVFFWSGPTAIFLPQAADAAIDALNEESELDQGFQSG